MNKRTHKAVREMMQEHASHAYAREYNSRRVDAQELQSWYLESLPEAEREAAEEFALEVAEEVAGPMNDPDLY